METSGVGHIERATPTSRLGARVFSSAYPDVLALVPG